MEFSIFATGYDILFSIFLHCQGSSEADPMFTKFYSKRELIVVEYMLQA